MTERAADPRRGCEPGVQAALAKSSNYPDVRHLATLPSEVIVKNFQNRPSLPSRAYIARIMEKLGNRAATILVIDDDECMRELLRIHLTSVGYEVVLAEDAIVGARAVLHKRPDIIVADIEMPFMDGLEFLQVLKSDPKTASIPFVFLTCHTEAEPRAKQLGATAFLTKPLRAGHLLSTLAKQLDAQVPA